MNKFKVIQLKLISFSFLRLFWDRVAAVAWRTSKAEKGALMRRLVASDPPLALESVPMLVLAAASETAISVSVLTPYTARLSPSAHAFCAYDLWRSSLSRILTGGLSCPTALLCKKVLIRI